MTDIRKQIRAAAATPAAGNLQYHLNKRGNGNDNYHLYQRGMRKEPYIQVMMKVVMIMHLYLLTLQNQLNQRCEFFNHVNECKRKEAYIQVMMKVVMIMHHYLLTLLPRVMCGTKYAQTPG
jgi:hypothetical protein